MTVIRGHYDATYNTLSVGNTELGFRESYSYRGRIINFDAIGETPADIIYAGININVDFVAMEFDAPAATILRWPFSVLPGQLSPAGLSMWQQAKPLILTSCNTGVNPQTKTYIKAILAPEFLLDINYNHQERPIPMRMIVFPVKFEASGDYTTPSLPDGCNDVVYYTETLWAP